MRVKVFLEKENAHKSMEIPKDHTIESLLKRMKINPQTVIVSRNGEVVTEQEILDDKDELKIFSVKLGG
ncbi:MAG: MoaD/ThiS family protein [Candidatus Aenigmarchaeota archaeon]|jgi:thiamine biosynthesis protein ThiS|nr:MoaD/ThiS family protein [Candidatus Aenigmarchaeota archaeon]